MARDGSIAAGACPICLENFSPGSLPAPPNDGLQQSSTSSAGVDDRTGGGVKGGVELVGADGLAAANMPCGHVYCSR